MNGRLNCRNAVNLLQGCQARLLSSQAQKPLSAAEKSKDDIPNPGSSKANNTTRNIVLGVTAVAIGAGIYYVSFLSECLMHWHCICIIVYIAHCVSKKKQPICFWASAG